MPASTVGELGQRAVVAARRVGEQRLGGLDARAERQRRASARGRRLEYGRAAAAAAVGRVDVGDVAAGDHVGQRGLLAGGHLAADRVGGRRDRGDVAQRERGVRRRRPRAASAPAPPEPVAWVTTTLSRRTVVASEVSTLAPSPAAETISRSSASPSSSTSVSSPGAVPRRARWRSVPPSTVSRYSRLERRRSAAAAAWPATPWTSIVSASSSTLTRVDAARDDDLVARRSPR